MTLVLNGTTGVSAVDGSAATPAIQGNDTNTGIFFPAADTVAIATGGTERVRTDSSGNVGIGTSSPGAKLQVTGSVSNAVAVFDKGGTNQAYTQLKNSSQSYSTYVDINNNGTNWLAQYDTTNAQLIDVYVPTSYRAFYTAGTERARIDSSGNLLVGTTTASGLVAAYKNASGRQTIYYAENASTAADAGARFRFKAGTQQTDLYLNSSGNDKRFYIENNGSGVYLADGGTSWTNTSDIREKVVLEPITNAAQKVSTLNAFIGRFKTDAEDKRRVFLSAQDVLAVLPEAVDATDENKLGLSYTDTIPLLVAAIQEQQALITDLTARIAALEAA